MGEQEVAKRGEKGGGGCEYQLNFGQGRSEQKKNGGGGMALLQTTTSIVRESNR